MDSHLLAAVVVAAAYLIGSVPFGVLLARRRGVDIQQVGSGNIGAANVARSVGRKLGLLVLVFDALKGALPVAAVLLLDLDQRVDPFVLTAAGMAAVLGHCFSPWLGFRGGKGVATSLGVFLVAAPAESGLIIAVFSAVYALSRIVSLGSMIAALALPVLLLASGGSAAVVTLAIAVAVLIVIKHRANIARLIRGEENKI
ncbi:MAG: glycerol-3-phosphate 1-O-acyltransferase PlsY [Myxococcota bacterium]